MKKGRTEQPLDTTCGHRGMGEQGLPQETGARTWA